jgi:hypothetical protein
MGSSSIATWVQNLILLVTAGIIVWYTIETYRLRREMVRQNVMSLRPLVLPEFVRAPNFGFFLKNCGAGCALNVRVSPIPIIANDNFGLGPSEVRFEPAYFMSVGERLGTPSKIWSAGVPTQRSPLDTWYFPQLPGDEVKFEIYFDDVEGGSYKIPVTIHAETDSNLLPRRVQIGSVTRIKFKA